MKLEIKKMEGESSESDWSSDTVSDEDVVNEHGHTKCKQAYIDYRESFKPLLADKISDPKEQYELIKGGFKGRGEFYDIIQVRDKYTNEFRAMKTFRKSELTDDIVKMMKREIELLMRLDHPNLCKIYDLIEDQEKVYLLIDDYKGQNLFEYIMARNSLKESETASIASQLVSVLCYLHKHGCVLRRIKLDSLVFGQQDSLSDLRMTDLMFFNYLDQIE